MYFVRLNNNIMNSLEGQRQSGFLSTSEYSEKCQKFLTVWLLSGAQLSRLECLEWPPLQQTLNSNLLLKVTVGELVHVGLIAERGN